MSIEFTEDICKTEYIHSLDSEDMKHYVEQLALAVLRYCFDEYDNLIVKDAPDLQSPDCSIGIEVTEIAVSKIKSIDGDFSQYRKTKDPKYLEKIREKGGTAEDDYYITPSVEKRHELEAMKAVFQKKLKKIPEYKRNGFGVLGLAMVMTEIPVPYTAFEWGNTVFPIMSSSKNKYDMVFFTYPSALSTLDCITGEVKFIPIGEKDYGAISKYDRVMVENKNKGLS